MVLSLPGLRVQSLGNVVPVIFDPKTNKIAQPNTSLAHKGEIKWTCADWVVFHKGLVQWFKEGRFQSKIKYSAEDANKQANQVVTQHWERNATFTSSLKLCGYGSAFYNYFVSVGMSDVVTSFLQRIANTGVKFAEGTADNVTKVATSAQKSLVNVVDSAGNVVTSVVDTAGSVASTAKYVLPVLIGGVVLFVGAYAYKNFIQGDGRISIPTPGGVVKV